MSIAKQAVRGAAWTILTSVVARALGLVGTLLLIRYVDPDAYGQVSDATVLVLTANQLSTLGVGIYVIANPKAGRDVTFHATILHITLGVLAIGVVTLMRHPLGTMFDAPDVGSYVPGLALAVLCDRVGFMPERILVRQMRFGRLGVSRTIAEITYTVVSLVTAMRGWGGMSVVWGNIARSVVKMVLMMSAAARREWFEPTRLRAKTFGELSLYGATVTVGGLAGFASRRWDNLLVSRFFGPAVLGAYNLAYNLADIPAVQVGEQVTDVLQASLAHLPAEQRAPALLRSTSLLALIMFPLAVGLGAISHTIADTFFDERWAGVGPMLLYLSALSIPRPIGGAIGSYLQIRSGPRPLAIVEVLTLGLLLGLIATMGRMGPLWTCSAVGIAFATRALMTMAFVRKLDGTPITRFLVELLPPALACVPMVLAVIGVREGLGAVGVVKHLPLLIAETLTGGVVYVAAALVIARKASRELLRLARQAVSRRRGRSE
jgi:PST family polysaccharide transporter